MIHNLLRTSDEQDSPAGQCSVKIAKHFVFSGFRKINQHIATDNQMTACGVGILQQIMFTKLDTSLNL